MGSASTSCIFYASTKAIRIAYMANEVELSVGCKKAQVRQRAFMIRTLHPRMIMEYKAPTVSITQDVFNQIAAYNMLLKVDYLVMSNGLQHYCCKMDYEGKKYLFLNDIPDFKNL